MPNISNFDFQNMKESLLGKQVFIKKNSISRNCMSADIKKETNHGQLPQKLKEFRKNMHRKKSSLKLSSHG